MTQEIRWVYVGPGVGQKILPTNIAEFQRLYSGNTGNLVYYFATQCVVQFKGGAQGVGAPTRILNRPGTGIVFSMANQLGSHTDLSEKGLRIDNLDVPVIGLGLGAQVKTMTDDLSFIPAGTIAWMKRFVEMAPSIGPNITVRGDYTLKVMQSLGFGDNVVATGCQTNFINPSRNLGKSIADYFKDRGSKKISVAAGSPFNQDHRRLEASLLSLALESGGDYVVQHPASMIQLVANFSNQEYMEAWEKIFPIYERLGFDRGVFAMAIRNNFKVYNDVPQWIRSHRQSDVIVGTRIHGIQSALQAGVPGICLYIDSRTKELCEKMKIPRASAIDYKDGITAEDIKRILQDWDYEEYDRTRLNLAKQLASFLISNSVSLSPSMKYLSGMEQVAPASVS